MAGGNYLDCSSCGSKALYDGDLDYSGFEGEVRALCAQCRAAGVHLAALRPHGWIRYTEGAKAPSYIPTLTAAGLFPERVDASPTAVVAALVLGTTPPPGPVGWVVYSEEYDSLVSHARATREDAERLMQRLDMSPAYGVYALVRIP